MSPCFFKSGRRCLFIAVLWVISRFFKIELKQIYCTYSRTKKIQNDFQSFLLLFLRSILFLNRNKNIVNDFLVFYEFLFPQTFILLPLPYRCFGVPEKEHEWKRNIAANKAQFLTNSPSKLRKCAVPPDHLGSEISFLCTCQQWRTWGFPHPGANSVLSPPPSLFMAA